MNPAGIIRTFGLIAILTLSAIAVQRDIVGSVGRGYFGGSVEALPNGNFVVADSLWDNGATVNVGQTSVIEVSSKRHSFAQPHFTSTLTDVDFVAEP